MKSWQEIVTHDTFRLIDHTEETIFHHKLYNAITSFAVDDALALSVSNRLSPPVVRLWVHDHTVVLGIPDGRLPYLNEGVKMLTQHGYDTMIRNSGGLAVALDRGVLNISLVLPGVKHISIDDCYEAMFRFVQHMLKDLTDDIEAYEIVGSYCPGKYDLSIGGIKFAGISQRRIKDGAAIQIYLDVEGNGRERAQLIKSFYDLTIRGEETRFTYPDIKPTTMGSLSELLNTPITINEMKMRVKKTLEQLSEKIISPTFSKQELITFEKRYDQMIKRNEVIKKQYR